MKTWIRLNKEMRLMAESYPKTMYKKDKWHWIDFRIRVEMLWDNETAW